MAEIKYKACPKCGAIMKIQEDRIYTSIPPQYGYECPNCGAFEYDTVYYPYTPEPDHFRDATKKMDKELVEAANDYCSLYYDWDNEQERKSVVATFITGAEWQKQQFEKNRLTACEAMTKEEYEMETDFVEQHVKANNRVPTFSDAINYGIEWQKQKMMEKAIEGTVWKSEHGACAVEVPSEDWQNLLADFETGAAVTLFVLKR